MPLSFVLWGLLEVPAHSGAELAEPHEAKAAELWAKGDLRGASRELEAAYALDPLPKYLYGLGAIAKQDGDCRRAIGYFGRYLESLPATQLTDEAKRDEIEAQVAAEIVACGGARRPPDDAKPAPKVEPPAPDPAPDPVVAPREAPWWRDPGGATSLALGTATASAGVALLVAGAVIDRNVTREGSAQEFLDTRARARRLGIAGAVVLPTGGALILAAIVRYVVVARRRATRSRRNDARSALVFTGLGLRW